jgi:regulator of sigma E protease
LLGSIATFISNYILIFLLILTVVVFVHELGHYLVARWNGVRVEVFSVGFGRELFGWTDRHGTRWRLSLLPLGGYVKMFGDADAASRPDATPLTPEEQKVSFQHKRVGQRAAIVAAGPIANFIFAIIGLALLFMVVGQVVTPALVGGVVPGSAAEQAGLLTGDRILSANGEEIERFQDLQRIVRMNQDDRLELVFERDGQQRQAVAQLRMSEMKDPLGNVQQGRFLGIQAPQGSTQVIRYGPGEAAWQAVKQVHLFVDLTLSEVGRMVSTGDAENLGGPIGIAKGAGQAAELGIDTVVFYMILLSINLGLINLFPIPLLDGGHLMFYGFEAVRGKPLGPKAQEYGFRIGFFLVFALMLIGTGNDLKVRTFLEQLFS